MANKKEITPQVTIGRHCYLCGRDFTLSHPKDPKNFCDNCLAVLRELTNERKTLEEKGNEK